MQNLCVVKLTNLKFIFLLLNLSRYTNNT